MQLFIRKHPALTILLSRVFAFINSVEFIKAFSQNIDGRPYAYAVVVKALVVVKACEALSHRWPQEMLVDWALCCIPFGCAEMLQVRCLPFGF